MEKNDIPTAFGVFKPVGHIVIAFARPDVMEQAASALVDLGFAPSAFTRYTPAEMLAQADAEIPNASPLASLGQELNLVKAHRELAASGHSFLVVEAPDDVQAEQVTRVAQRFQATSAQRYGRFLIEELTDHLEGSEQVFESAARGLDGQTSPTQSQSQSQTVDEVRSSTARLLQPAPAQQMV